MGSRRWTGRSEDQLLLFKAASNVAGILFHLPSGQISKILEGAAALAEGRTRVNRAWP